ncbi:ATPase, V1/A1 complex, subunit E domain-containing protein [Rozella allomycis CSF55]|uniref:ATPase, V1/A1 complex, subunit E domain-containing protein n=1 Tax=Rozella allomycis (strain CSF55) TaxID=988480 RepID=A0A075B1Y1_ROZAC|nr:ATPase, V1/A1 complex, subunit E domain-containing protein [Rozella allomycis CSF55]|eukprot:EPZ36540.1 ATPase, V1/A1 complex, subunit E domain-containing protein [Rozella allomycis CSF55]
MSAPRPLTDEEVQNEMKKMVAFIKQEAIEKAREIQVKADEEFNIEKAKLVRQETLAIEANYARKFKQAEVSRKIAQSTHFNKARLKVLQTRDQMIEELYNDAKSRLPTLAKDHQQYQAILNDLVLQCFYQLMETNIVIQCRRQDEEMVKNAIQYACEQYNSQLHRNVNATIDSQYLFDTCAGGIIASANDGRIRCANTFESRLELLSQQMLPDIRLMLFGPSENRKFFD